MVRRIYGAVGVWDKGAVNLHRDVVTIQELLETAAELKSRPDFDPKGVDGKIARPPRDSNTVKAILAFQSTFLKEPDGMVEPYKMSLKKLNEAVKLGEKNVAMMPIKGVNANQYFPLSYVPQLSYKTGARYFGARRSKGKRKHAGCDLVVPEGTRIYAVDNGVVARGPYLFYKRTSAIDIVHPNFVARYCEISRVADGIKEGAKVAAGQHIAYVGKMTVDSMLHFELYEGTATGPLSQKNNPPYQRRSDLLDPAPYLDWWKNNLPS